MDDVLKIDQRKQQIAAKQANLSGSTFDDVNLSGAVFSNANLTGAAISESMTDGMTIDGIPVSELLAVWRDAQAETPDEERN